MATQNLPQGERSYTVRAKYYPDEDGNRLASIAWASKPIFRQGGARSEPEREEQENERADALICRREDGASDPEALQRRARRRAAVRAFDLLQCNRDLCVFGTLTFDRARTDAATWADVYQRLKPWLSNAVQRRGAKYVVVPEYHHDGEHIHFHGMFSQAFPLEAAVRDGRALRSHGKAVFNFSSWLWGFSTGVILGCGKLDRDAAAKYVFKYMGKDTARKIGGRYFLSGGDLTEPVFRYGDDPAAFTAGQAARYDTEFRLDDSSFWYKESFFI